VERRDGLGRLVARVQTLAGAELSALFTYDPAGNLLSRTDPEHAAAAYAYDGRGRRTRLVDPDLGEHHFIYDATSNLVAHSYPDGKTARFTFDLAGRSLTEDHDGDGTPEVTRTWDTNPEGDGNTLTRDALARDALARDALARGKLVRVTGPSGETRHVYDERGRTTQTTLIIDGTTYQVGSEFDDQDRESRHIYTDGSSIDLHRNPRGQLDGYGQALAIEYGGDGLETARRFSTGVKVTSDYDDDRRRTDLRVQASDGAVLESLHWTYDSAGNLLEQQDRRDKVAPTKEDRSESYAYDNLYRLVGVRGAWGTGSWSYSPSGSLLSRESSVKDQAIGSVTYGARPHAPVAFDGRKIVYDARGRMTTDGERSYTWNDVDELVAVSKSGASEESTYDGDGTRRIRVEHGANAKPTTTHFIDPWSDVKDGELIRYIVHGGQRVVRLGTRSAREGGVAAPGRPANAALCFVVLLAALAMRGIRSIPRAGRARWALAALVLTTVSLAACDGPGSAPLPEDTAPHAGAPSSHSTVARGDAIGELTDEDTLLTTDLLGSLLGETTPSGKSTGRFASYPFGATRLDTSSETGKYAGAPRDASVGLDAMGARFYAPDLGVWTSGDPLAVTAPEQLVGADFAAANPYAYAKDSPLLAADRDGHFWHIAFGAAAGFLIGGAIEAGHQYLEHGKIESWGRVGGAALGGGVSGAIIAANPAAGIGSVMGTGALAGGAEGVTNRLVQSGGHDAGTLKELVVDTAVGGLTAGALHGGAKLVKAVVRKAPTAARALTSKVGSALEGRGACPCFAAGTLVATPQGPKPIDALHVGDLVTSRDEATGETTTRPVTRVFVTPDKDVLDLSFAHPDGTVETITATPGHPFRVEGTGWVEARDLALGATVQTAESGLATLSATLSRAERTTVYNLEVEGTHTYFVGRTTAWVHNACGCGGGNARFNVTPNGVSIPTGAEELKANMIHLADASTNPTSSRKFVGRDSQGPIRVRIEQAHSPTPDFSGTPDPLHVVDHLHIDRKVNGETGRWLSSENVPYDWPFKN
jgi:RHS repeat-associated protein